MNKYRHVHVRFKDNGTTYTYRVPNKYKIAKGQFVVVLGHEGKCILQVREVLEDYVEKLGIKYKSIYGIVNLVVDSK
jgi:cell fate regulator YaaT (PSP1 superfamily)